MVTGVLLGWAKGEGGRVKVVQFGKVGVRCLVKEGLNQGRGLAYQPRYV